MGRNKWETGNMIGLHGTGKYFVVYSTGNEDFGLGEEAFKCIQVREIRKCLFI